MSQIEAQGPSLKSIRDISALVIKQLRVGCLCSIHSNSFGVLLRLTFEIIHRSDFHLLSGLVQVETSKALLAALSCLRKLVQAYVKFDVPENDDEQEEGTICKQLLEWILLLVRLKFNILGGLSHLWPQTSHISHLRTSLESLHHLLLVCLPCPSRLTNGDNCRRTCQKMLENSAQIKGPNHELATSLFYSIFCLIDKQLNSPKRGAKVPVRTCQTSNVKVRCQARVHFHTMKQLATNELKTNWKQWMEKSLSSSALNVGKKLEIFTLWKSLVAVESNLGSAQSREFVLSACKLVPRIVTEENHLIAQKEFDILNAVLCYGTTLGIQSSIPCEVSDISQSLMRQAKTVPFSEFRIPKIFSGLGGNRFRVVNEETNEDEDLDCRVDEAPSICIMQGLVLLNLKVCALIVREAQCCSSSDSSASDSSLSSHGSSSICEAENDMKLIEGNVMFVLGKLKEWIVEQLELPTDSKLSQCIVILFNEQDDAMIESLLCMLDIFTGLHFGIYSHKNHLLTPEMESPEHISALQEALDPIEAFDAFQQNISGDSSVLLDFLVSNETCFLLYFLRFAKFLVKMPRSDQEHPGVYPVLKKLHSSIKKLTKKSLFPYEITPVLKQLEKIVLQGTHQLTRDPIHR